MTLLPEELEEIEGAVRCTDEKEKRQSS
jgi:hypothetical protein